MSNVWQSDQKNSSRQATINNANSGKMPSSLSRQHWSRQQKIGAIVTLGLLGLLLAVSAGSRQPAKPALVAVSGSASSSMEFSPSTAATNAAAEPVVTTASASTVSATSAATAGKKARKKRPANVSYNDANYGVSFLYPRKFSLTTPSGETEQAEQAAVADVPMNFVQPGGVTVAAVTVPAEAYPGTDFASAFFQVNVNRRVSEQECSHFAFVDTRNADGEPVDAEKVKVGSSEMLMTSDFSASAIKQAETEYYHRFENGACYEYVLGLGTEGFGTEDGIEHVDREAVFGRLEKILATVKIKAVETEHVPEETTASLGGSEE
jgi:hypothetical protein